MEKLVYLVRHGETDSNASGIMLGVAAMLTEKGKKEAQIVAERIERIGVEALMSSTLQRAVDTATAISERIQLPFEKSELFGETRRPTALLGQSWKDPATQRFDDEQLEAFVRDSSYRHSDEENFEDIKKRALAALKHLQEHSAQRICVVTHGIFLKALFGVAMLGDSFDAQDYQKMYRGLRANNTGITVLRFDGSSWQAVTWNDAAHLG